MFKDVNTWNHAQTFWSILGKALSPHSLVAQTEGPPSTQLPTEAQPASQPAAGRGRGHCREATCQGDRSIQPRAPPTPVPLGWHMGFQNARLWLSILTEFSPKETW